MASPQLTIRIAANIDELRKNLAEGKASVEALGPSVDKLAGTWNRRSASLVQDARNIVAAVDKVGASTLTAGDSARALKTLDAAMEQLRATSQRVPPEIQRTADQLRAATDRTTTFGGVVSKLGPMVVGAFSVGAIVEFTRSIIASADEIQKMSDRTGIGVEQVQKLKFIADQSGTSLDAMASAAQNLQQRLGDDDKGAVGALAKLSINADDFNQLNTYKQVEELAASMSRVEDPTQRASIAADLFGKSWKEIMPALLSDFKALADEAPVMSAATVRALDEAGDAWDKYASKLKVEAAHVAVWYARIGEAARVGMTDPVKAGMIVVGITADDLAKQKLPLVESAFSSLTSRGAQPLAMSMDDADAVAKRLASTMPTVSREAAEAQKRTAAWHESIRAASEQMVWLSGMFSSLPPAITPANTELLNAARAANDFEAAIALSGRSFAGFMGLMPAVKPAMGGLIADFRNSARAADEAATAIRTKFADVIRNLPQTLRSAFEGGGGLIGALKSIGVQLGDALAGSFLDSLAKQLMNSAAAKSVSKAIAGMFSGGGISVLAPIAGIGGFLYGLSSMLRSSAEHARIAAENMRLAAENAKAYAKELQDVGEQYDGLLAQVKVVPVKSLGLIPGSLDRDIAQMRKAIPILEEIVTTEKELAGIQAAIARTPGWDEVDAAAQKYKITIAQLGRAGQQLKANTDATGMLNDFEMLKKALGDGAAGDILSGMRDEISALVQESLKFGTTIPANMQPLIKVLLDSKQLVDENGKAITDITKLKFGDPVETEGDKMQRQFEETLKKLNDLAEKLAEIPNDSAEAADRTYRYWKEPPWAHWQQPQWPTPPGSPGYGPRAPGERGYAPTGYGPTNERTGTTVIPVRVDGRTLTRLTIRHTGSVLSVMGGR